MCSGIGADHVLYMDTLQGLELFARIILVQGNGAYISNEDGLVRRRLLVIVFR
jgi:hypothetical protein